MTYNINPANLSVQDIDDASLPANEVDALVASGDCFVTLATELDALSHEENRDIVTEKLEKTVRSLLYLQRHYKITRQQPNFRQ